MACLELEQRLESFTMDQATLRAEMLQGQAAMEAQMRQEAEAMEAIVIGQESLEKRMESIVDGITQQAEGIAQQTDGFAQQARESNAQTLDKLVALDSKVDKLAHVQEQQARIQSAHIFRVPTGHDEGTWTITGT